MLGYRRFLCLLPAVALSTAASAAEREWLKLQGPSFGVVSQLNEADTRRWAVEFDQFIGAMHDLYDVKEVDLAPLTIVLFKDGRDFAPYRLVTQSGQAQVAGFFGRKGDWSVIGMSGGARASTTRRTIYHEAVHWFASGANTRSPLWFSEGLAEVLSTFRSIEGKGRWGEAIEDNVGYLQYVGIMPIEDLLHASQDEALHGSDKYYPQAWAFVHYLMFGNGGTQRAKLAELLRLQKTSDIDTAFDTAFGKSYKDFDSEMRGYLRNGRYGYAEIALRDRSGEMTVVPATEANVEFALGRLATVAGNTELAIAHADRVIALVPDAAAGYELRAYATTEADDRAVFDAAVARAIELGSRDAFLYEAQANDLVASNQRDNGFIDDLLSPEVARTAANLYQRALGLRPRSETALPGLVVALLNVDTLTESDQLTLNVSRVMFPTSGLLLVGQAAIERQSGNVREASRLLRQATLEPFTLPQQHHRAVVALRTNWLGQWLSEEMSALISDQQFAAARTLAAEHLADDTLPTPLRTMLENVQKDLPDMERIRSALDAGEAGKRQEAIAILTDLADSPSTGERPRRTAERILQDLGVRGPR